MDKYDHRAPYKRAYEMVAERALSIFFVHLHRNGGRIDQLQPQKHKELQNFLSKTLLKVQEKIEEWAPCDSFTTTFGHRIPCNNSKHSHKEHASQLSVVWPHFSFGGRTTVTLNEQSVCDHIINGLTAVTASVGGVLATSAAGSEAALAAVALVGAGASTAIGIAAGAAVVIGITAMAINASTHQLSAVRWKGSHQPVNIKDMKSIAEEQLNKSVENEQLIKEHNNKHRDLLKNLFTDRVCLFCLLSLPSKPLSCGHVACDTCYNQISESKQCSFCMKTLTPPVRIPQQAGYRVLSLDGGGVRGAVTLEVLDKIQEKLGVTNIIDMFDYVIGTSVGGIIALGLAGKRLTINSAKTLLHSIGKNVFQKGIWTLWSMLTRQQWYTRETLHKQLHDVLGDTKLLANGNTVEIAATSATTKEGMLKTVLFTSYMREAYEDSHPLYHASMTEAAEATSAAGGYFPIFNMNGEAFTDGGMLANNPCKIGYAEASHLWPLHPCDLVVSIGTGKWKNTESKTSLSNTLPETLKHLVAIATNSETAFKELLSGPHSKVPTQGIFRLNPDMSNNYDLADYSSVDKMIADAKGISEEEVDKVAAAIYAANFFFEKATLEVPGSGILSGKIVSRYSQLSLSSKNNFLFITVTDENNAPLVTEHVSGSNISVPNLPIGIPLRLMIHISRFDFIGLNYKGSFPISGAPFLFELQ